MRWALPLVLLSVPAWAQSPCDGQITDKLDHPLVYGAVSKPAPGQSYVDPVFGNLITRITHSDGSEGDLAVTKTLYNTMRAWNADDSLIIAWDRGAPSKHYEIYQGDKPYGFLCTLDTAGTFTTPADIEHIIWDPSDPNVLYYPSGYSQSGPADPRLMKITLTDVNKAGGSCDKTVELVRLFDTECTPYSLTAPLRLGHAHDMALLGSQKFVQLICGSTASTEPKLHMLYSIAEDRIAGSFVSNTGNLHPFQSGQGAYDRLSGNVYDVDMNVLRVIGPADQEHSAMAWMPSKDVFNTVHFGSTTTFPHVGSLLSVDMADGAVTHIISETTGWPYPRSGTHPSLGAADGSGWVAVSHMGYPSGSPPQMGQRVLENEITLANVGTGEVCRIAHARTHEARMATGYLWNYWAEPHPQISKDGYRVLFNSDWLGSDSVDMYVVDVRPQDTTILTTALPNAVVGEVYGFGLSVTGGQPPYTCGVTAGTPPAGLSMVGCDVAGTPTQIETQTYTVQACDTVPQCDSKEFTHTTQERPEILTVSPLPNAPVGSLYSQAFTAQKGILPYTWSTAGNTCSTAFVGADLTGTPLCLETCSFSVTVTDSHAQPISATEPFEFDVIVPSGGGCPCAPVGLTVEVTQ